jgi:hypothetical protein
MSAEMLQLGCKLLNVEHGVRLHAADSPSPAAAEAVQAEAPRGAPKNMGGSPAVKHPKSSKLSRFCDL